MKRYCKNINITDKSLIKRAAYRCLDGKFTRNDSLGMFHDISGLKENQIYVIFKRYGKLGLKPFINILINAIQNELINKNISYPLIWYRDKVDPSSGKVRHIGIQNIKQQIYDYIAVEGLKPILKRIGTHQYASVRSRGQVKGVRQIKRWLRNKSIRYFAKLDIKKCYPSIGQDKIMEFLSRHIKNEMLLWLIRKLISSFELGLSIGSYLSQFLCNLFLSQLYHFVGHIHKVRKHKNGTKENVRLIKKRLFYMDDVLLLSSSAKDLKSAIKTIIKYCKNELGLTIKESFFIEKITCIKFIDIMGFRVYKDHITIRRRVFIRIRRVYSKVYKAFKTHKKIAIENARQVLSYLGLLKNSDSTKFVKKYHVYNVVKISKEVLRRYENRRIFRTATAC